MLVARHLMVWALLWWAAAAWAQQGGDYQAQILYAYQTEDTNSLANLSQDLTARVKEDRNDASLRYHLAHAQYRRGLLAGTPRAHEAETAFADCIDELKPVLSQDVKSVEAMVLQSACYAGLASHRKLESVLLRSRSEERLNAALSVSVQHEGTESRAARHRPAATRVRAVAVCRAIVRRVLGHEHRYARLG